MKKLISVLVGLSLLITLNACQVKVKTPEVNQTHTKETR